MIDKFNNKKITILLILMLIGITALTGTYAWLTWGSTENTELTMTIGDIAEVLFKSGNDITAELTPVFNYYDGVNTTFRINNRDTTGATIKYTVKLNITSIPTELRRTDVKYALTKGDTLVANGNLKSASDGVSIDVYTGSLDSGFTDYVFYLYIDGNEENPSTMIDKTIIGNIIVEAYQISGTLANHISNL